MPVLIHCDRSEVAHEQPSDFECEMLARAYLRQPRLFSDVMADARRMTGGHEVCEKGIRRGLMLLRGLYEIARTAEAGKR